MTKQLLGLRLDANIVQRYRDAAKEANQTITEYVTERLTNGLHGTIQENKNRVLEAELKRVQDQLTKLTGRKPNRSRTISIKVTPEEHYAFSQMAKTKGLTNADLFRSVFAAPTNPQLTVS